MEKVHDKDSFYKIYDWAGSDRSKLPWAHDEPQSKIGPTRVSREDIQKFFAPELKERFFAVEEINGLAEIVGASMAQGYYWFKRVSTDCC